MHLEVLACTFPIELQLPSSNRLPQSIEAMPSGSAGALAGPISQLSLGVDIDARALCASCVSSGPLNHASVLGSSRRLSGFNRGNMCHQRPMSRCLRWTYRCCAPFGAVHSCRHLEISFGRNASSQGVLNGMVRDANRPYHGDACCDSRSEVGRNVSAGWLTRIRLRIPTRMMRSRTRTALRRLRYHRGKDNDLHDTSHLSSGQNGSHAVKVPRVRLSNRHASSRTSADKRSVP